jgi:uncharacterized OB-fold protein
MNDGFAMPPSKPYNQRLWEAAAEGHLEIQRCVSCGEHIYPSRIACPHCSGNLEWDAVSGTGMVYSYTVLHHPDPPGAVAEDDLPILGAIVELDEGPLFATTLVDCAAEDVEIGTQVQAAFEEAPDGRTLPKFTPTA